MEADVEFLNQYADHKRESFGKKLISKYVIVT